LRPLVLSGVALRRKTPSTIANNPNKAATRRLLQTNMMMILLIQTM
jgi:hypothetical protein